VEGPDKNLATIFDRLGWRKNDKLNVEVNGRRIRLVKDQDAGTTATGPAVVLPS
jgi:hypothetical protein